MILVCTARVFLVSMRVDKCITAFILTSLFEPRYNPEHLYCANDDRRNDVNHFCEIASRAHNLHASLVKSQCDK